MFNLETTVRHLRSLRSTRPGAAGKRSNRRRTTALECLEERCCPSTVDIWLGGAGNYSNAANWSLGVVPNNGNSYNGEPATFTVEIANSSAVTLDINPTIDNLTIDATSSLSISNGQSLTVVGSGATTGMIDNSGTIALGATGNGASLMASGNVRLTGGGTVTMSNSSENLIDQAASNSTLTNVNNTIEGSGNIGDNGLSLNNQSLIDANQSSALLVAASAITNTGTLEATGGGTLEIHSSSVTNTNGTISTDGSSSSVILYNSSITGGNLTSTNGAEIHGLGNPSLDGVTITSGWTYSVDPGQSTSLTGNLTNHGAVLIGNSGGGAILYAAAPTFYLSGGGTVTLNNASSHLRGSASSDTLVNTDNTIQGQGEIDGLNFINQATVNANVPGGTTDALTIQAPTTNTGRLEATGGGTLYFLVSVVTNTSGTISTDGSSSVTLNASEIIGGNLTSTNGAEIHGIAGSALDGVTITSGSTFSVDPGQSTFLTGDLNNMGTVVVGGGGILIADVSAVNLSGGGTVILNTGSLAGNTSSDYLVNKDNTIQGQGNIDVSVINQAIVDANVAGGTLTVQAPTTNTGTLEATGGGTLYFLAAVVTNTSGTISTDSSSSVDLNDTAIIGGDLTSPSGAAIHAISNSLLDGVTITSGSTLSVDNGGSVNLTGDLINKGTIVIGGNGAYLTAYDSTVTLSGGGTVILSDPSSVIGGNGELSPLVNEDNTIQGQGNIEVDLINQGTVNANVAGGTLTITVDNTANLGTMEASGGGTLYFQAAAYPGDTINNTNGTISTDGSSSVILNHTEVLGGNLTSAGSAAIHAEFAALDGATITSGSTLSLDDDSNTSVSGDLINNGTVVLGSYSGTNPPNLVYSVPFATLSGDGAVGTPLSSGLGTGTFLTNLGNTIPAPGAGSGLIVRSATSADPTATTQVATDVTGTSATLNGGVNPEGSATTVSFVYGTDPTLTTGATTTAAVPIGGGFSDVALTAPLAGLQPGTTYYEEVVATNNHGTVDGPIVSFTTLAPATATTQPASNVTATAATLNGSVDPEGNETTVTFVYGTDPTLTTGTTSTAAVPIGSGTSAVPVTAALTGLQPGTTYYDEVVATNSGGTTDGKILSFTTPATTTTTTTNLTPSVSTSVYGQSITFTAAVSQTTSGFPTPTGTVQFQADGVNLGSGVTLVNGTATSSPISSLAAGGHTITAIYSGDPDDASSSGSTSLTVNQAPLTVTAASQSMTYGGAVPTPTYTLTGFVNGDTSAVVSGTPTLTPGATSSSPVGTYAISVTLGSLAAANYDFPNLVSGTLTVNQASTTTALAASVNPSVYGQSVTFTATVGVVAPGSGTPTGTVAFQEGSTTLATETLGVSGTVSLTTSALAVGSATSRRSTAVTRTSGRAPRPRPRPSTRPVPRPISRRARPRRPPARRSRSRRRSRSSRPARGRRRARCNSSSARPRWARPVSAAIPPSSRRLRRRSGPTRSPRNTRATPTSPPVRRAPCRSRSTPPASPRPRPSRLP
jgi:large repetitive protein